MTSLENQVLPLLCGNPNHIISHTILLSYPFQSSLKVTSDLEKSVSQRREAENITKIGTERISSVQTWRHEALRDRWMSEGEEDEDSRMIEKYWMEWLAKREQKGVLSFSPHPIRPFSSSAWRSSDQIEFIWRSPSLSLWGGEAMIRVIIIYYGRIPSQAKHLILQYSTAPYIHTHTHRETQTHILNVTLWNNLPLDILNGLGSLSKSCIC